MDQVAKSARLSRALVYVYFRDRDELMFAIGWRAMQVLRERFEAAAARHAKGFDQLLAIGRAYMAYAYEFPHYFDACARFQAHSVALDPGSNESACSEAGELAIAVVVRAIATGIADGSIRHDIGQPLKVAVAMWAFTHGVIQLAISKGADLARLGIPAPELSEVAFGLLSDMAAPRAAR